MSRRRQSLEKRVPNAAVEVRMALDDGDRKHGIRSWDRPDAPLHRHFAAIQRHMAKFASGDDRDEVQIHHMGAVMARAAIIIELQYNGAGKDWRRE